jgi:DNA-binding MarR family transcriptional regulator
MPIDAVSRIRRFNRAVTAEVGALDTSFLGRGRPLGAARVLNAIGHGRGEVGTLRDYLGLDSGLMSRLLRGLEEEGLVVTLPHPSDARRRVAVLTEAGRREFSAYEALSNAQAGSLLERFPRGEELLRAMDLVATALNHARIAIEEADPRSEPALHCLTAYYAELGRRLAAGFDVALSRDPEAADMMRPRGTVRVASAAGLPIGGVGL